MAQNNRNKVYWMLRKSKTKCCHYCGIKLKLAKRGLDGDKQDSNTATREHLYSKLDIRRLLSNKSVLSCYDCNYERSKREYNLVHHNGTYYDATSENARGLIIKLLNNEINRFII